MTLEDFHLPSTGLSMFTLVFRSRRNRERDNAMSTNRSDSSVGIPVPENAGPVGPDELLPVVYHELRKLAYARFRDLPPGQTLQATALVHEAWVRLTGPGANPGWNGRGHFFAAAAEAMRRILVERARKKGALKYGGGRKRIDMTKVDLATDAESDVVLAVHEALEELADEDPVGAELVKLRFFVGLPNREAARVLGLSERTAKRNWTYVRCRLFQALKKKL